MRAALLIGIGLVLAPALEVEARAAEPILEVHGRMRLTVDRIERVARGLIVGGSLLDEATNEPMQGERVLLRVSRLEGGGGEDGVYAVTALADGDGNFQVAVPDLARQRHVLRLSAEGNADFVAPAGVERVVDLERRTLELRLSAPVEHPASTPALPISIEVYGLEQASPVLDAAPDVELPVEIDIDGVPVATVVARGGKAVTTLALPATAAGREVVLRARFAGDATRSPAEASARVRIVEQTVLELHAEAGRVRTGDEVALVGHLLTGTRPVSGAAILVRRIAAPEAPEDAPFASLRTDGAGTFRARVRAPWREGPASFEASFAPAEARARGLSPATSAVVVVEVTAGLAFGLIERRPAGLALAIGALLVVTLGWERMRAWLRGRRARRLDVLEAPTDAPPRKLFATLRMPSDRRVAGHVRDAERGRPLDGVRVSLRVGGAAPTIVITGDDGAFSFGEVSPGDVELRVEHPGHAPRGKTGVVPHRGELAALDLELMPLRGELLRRYDELLAPYLAGGERLGRLTPRELADAVARRAQKEQRRAPTPEVLGALRALVEERCFGAARVGPEALADLEKIAERI